MSIPPPHTRSGQGGVGVRGVGSVLAENMALACEGTQLLLLQVVDGKGVGCHHDHHGDVERQEGAKDEKVFIDHLAYVRSWHDIMDIYQGQDWDGGGQQHAQAPGEDDSVQHRALTLRPLSEWPPDAAISSDRDEHQVEDGGGAGKNIAGLVKDTPTL